MYIDVHAHLDLYESLPEVLERAKKARVSYIITAGTSPTTNQTTLNLAKQHLQIKAALGLYPIEALNLSPSELTKCFSDIKKHKNDIIAIGEVGMDFKESTDQEKQRVIFRKIITLATEIDKPLIVHSRKAEEACIEELEALKAKKVVMHCFSGSRKLIQRCIANGWFLSVPAMVKRSEHFQLLVKETPLTQLLAETDSPYLHPDKLWPNEPVQVVQSYAKIAEIKSLSLKDVEKALEANVKRLFGF